MQINYELPFGAGEKVIEVAVKIVKEKEIGFLEPVAFSNLSPDASNLIKNYYSDKWSVFNESLLTNEEKAEIVGDLLSTSVYDETSAESTSLSLKYKLFDAIQNGNKVRWESKIN